MSIQMEATPQLIKLLIEQNQFTCNFALDKISSENLHWKLNEQAASIGFIFRHLGEAQLRLGTFLGEQTEVSNTTMGFQDTGQGADLEASRHLVEAGYGMLFSLAAERDSEWWMGTTSTPFFGEIERIRMLGHILNHNAHHTGQIALVLSRYSTGE